VFVCPYDFTPANTLWAGVFSARFMGLGVFRSSPSPAKPPGITHQVYVNTALSKILNISTHTVLTTLYNILYGPRSKSPIWSAFSLDESRGPP